MTIALLGRGLDAILQHDLAGMPRQITDAARLQRYECARQLRRAQLSPEAREIDQLREQFGRNYQTAWRNGQRPDLTQLPLRFAAIDKEHKHACSVPPEALFLGIVQARPVASQALNNSLSLLARGVPSDGLSGVANAIAPSRDDVDRCPPEASGRLICDHSRIDNQLPSVYFQGPCHD
ncbi:hypothetical protein P2A10_17465 [Xanthomonas perforans]